MNCMLVGVRAIRDAGVELRRRYDEFAPIPNAPANISTDADRAAQEIILERLAREYPDHQLRAEEATPTLTDAQRRPPSAWMWIVDPIDGTRGFARKNGEFSVMIGLAFQGRVVLGLVFEPMADRLTYGLKGGGCFVRQPWDAEPRRCRVTNTTTLSAATIALSRSRKASGADRLRVLFGARATTPTYSAGIKLALVARGEADLYLGDYPVLREWDVCAGHLLVEEAGGRVTDLAGEPLDYAQDPPILERGLLATNGALHDAALAIVAARPDGLY